MISNSYPNPLQTNSFVKYNKNESPEKEYFEKTKIQFLKLFVAIEIKSICQTGLKLVLSKKIILNDCSCHKSKAKSS